MQAVDALVECSIRDSFRVQQIGGMFGLQNASKAAVRFSVELPSNDEQWTIGAIVGPSGSGKSVVAEKAYGNRLYRPTPWDNSLAVIDGFGEHETKKITHLLTAVGFSSPPAWVKPYAVLSNGEKFRCELVRAFLSGDLLIAFDEFTSVVDRNVGRICSAAIAKAIRNGLIGKQFVAITCHYDVLDWLQVDWYLDMADGKLARGRLQRPRIDLSVHETSRALWSMFKRHHYLNGQLAVAGVCYVGFVQSVPVAFAAATRFWGKTRRKLWRIVRLVVLPDYQGVGIGSRFLDTVAQLVREKTSADVRIVTGHPGFIQHLSKSSRWRVDRVKLFGTDRSIKDRRDSVIRSTGRAIISAEYVAAS